MRIAVSHISDVVKAEFFVLESRGYRSRAIIRLVAVGVNPTMNTWWCNEYKNVILGKCKMPIK